MSSSSLRKDTNFVVSIPSASKSNLNSETLNKLIFGSYTYDPGSTTSFSS